jgi:hypothetical protein
MTLSHDRMVSLSWGPISLETECGLAHFGNRKQRGPNAKSGPRWPTNVDQPKWRARCETLTRLAIRGLAG